MAAGRWVGRGRPTAAHPSGRRRSPYHGRRRPPQEAPTAAARRPTHRHGRLPGGAGPAGLPVDVRRAGRLGVPSEGVSVGLIELDVAAQPDPAPGTLPPAHRYRLPGLLLVAVLTIALGGSTPASSQLWRYLGAISST